MKFLILSYLSVAFELLREWLIYLSAEKFRAFKWEINYSYLRVFQNISCLQSTDMLFSNNCDQGSSSVAEAA